MPAKTRATKRKANTTQPTDTSTESPPSRLIEILSAAISADPILRQQLASVLQPTTPAEPTASTSQQQQPTYKFAEIEEKKIKQLEEAVFGSRLNYEVVTRVDKLLEEAHDIYYIYHKKLDSVYRARVLSMIMRLRELPHLYDARRNGNYQNAADVLNERGSEPRRSIPTATPSISASCSDTLEDSGKDNLSGDWSGDIKRTRMS